MEKATNIVNLHKKEPWEVQWDKCKSLVEKAIEYQDSYTIDDVEAKIRNGIALLWPGKELSLIHI